MPPKPSKKENQKKQAKIIEDKTFGLKNKNKSKKVQQFVQQVHQTVKLRGRDHKTIKKEDEEQKKKKLEKAAKEEKDKELTSLFKAVAQVKQAAVAKGEDPKSVLCAYHKAGVCMRGDKCKFSHDLGLSRKGAKISVYADPRAADTMDTWDQNKLEQVVAEKNVVRPNQTDIICKYFLDAIENQKYGWFWQCPNGDTCIYRHALPPGYKLKTKEDKDEKKDAGPPIEELIELERAKLDSSSLTMVTEDEFQKWKERRRKKKDAEIEALRKEADKKGSNRSHGLSGRSLFIYDPSLFVDDDDAAGQDSYEIQEDTLETVEEDEKKERLYGDDNNADDDQNAAVTVKDASLFLDDVEIPDEEEDDEEENGDDNNQNHENNETQNTNEN